DPEGCDVPGAVALGRDRLAGRRRLLSRRAARPVDATRSAGDTVAVVTADGAGNAVSMIQSLYHEFGAGVVAGDTGVLLQNRGAFFSLDPEHPNRLAPRKRTATTLIPSMYLAGGRPRFVYGTMRGDRLVTMCAWRWAVFLVSYYVGRGLIRAARLLAYATAGLLTRRELGRATAGRWSDFGIDETYVLSGLFTWEENFYFRFLKPD